MGQLTNNNVMGTTRGRVGLVVFRLVRGKLIASNRPKRRSAEPSEKQLKTVSRFTRASRYARAALEIPELRQKYEAGIGGNLFSSRLVAMSDYMNSPTIEEINLTSYHGMPGDIITVRAEDDFRVTRVNVTILLSGKVIESGEATEDTLQAVWHYKVTTAATEPVTIRVAAFDLPGNVTVLEKIVDEVNGGLDSGL